MSTDGRIAKIQKHDQVTQLPVILYTEAAGTHPLLERTPAYQASVTSSSQSYTYLS